MKCKRVISSRFSWAFRGKWYYVAGKTAVRLNDKVESLNSDTNLGDVPRGVDTASEMERIRIGIDTMPISNIATYEGFLLRARLAFFSYRIISFAAWEMSKWFMTKN